MNLNVKPFLLYKLLNSLFTGISIGILFTIYTPLDPSIYSLGGIILAASMLLIARYYEQLLNIKSFYYISLMVELIMLLTIIIFIILKYSLVSALIIYALYQFTFIFGSYLVRAETIVAKDKALLSKIDVYKQVGYLLGLCLSFIFYKIIEDNFLISDTKTQIIFLNYILLILQIIIISFLQVSFSSSE
tara:strand:- start:4812 stop:5378 length:567 start_codon:yes stop_codon:yes gene_type:complete